MGKPPLARFGSSSALRPPPRHGTKTPPVALGGRGRGRPVPTAAVAAARRGRGGAAPPPLSPNRVTGGAARVCLRAHECGPNSLDRSRPPLHSGCPYPAGPRPRVVAPGCARLSAWPRLPSPSPATHRPTCLRDARGEASAGSSGLARDLRAATFPPPGGGSGGAAAVTRRPRGGKLRPLPAPPAAALPPLGTKETKPRRPARAPLLPPPSRRAALPPRAARVRPEAARRAGCAVPAPRDPSFRSRGIGVCEGPGWGG